LRDPGSVLLVRMMLPDGRHGSIVLEPDQAGERYALAWATPKEKAALLVAGYFARKGANEA
jgi:hypothetical protein